MTSSWKWPILIAKELLSRLELYVSRKTSLPFLTVHVLKPKAAVPLYRSSLLANQKKQVLILLVHVLTRNFPWYATVSTKYKTADLNDSYSRSLVITVAVERRRRPAVLFSVPTPHKPTTDWAIDHGLQKQRQILQVPTVVAKNSWCIKTTLKKKSWNIVLDGTILSVKQTGDLKFSRESKIALQISWRTESESGYVWTGKFDLNTDTCGRANFWIRKEKFADSKIPGYVWTGAKGTIALPFR